MKVIHKVFEIWFFLDLVFSVIILQASDCIKSNNSTDDNKALGNEFLGLFSALRATLNFFGKGYFVTGLHEWSFRRVMTVQFSVFALQTAIFLTACILFSDLRYDTLQIGEIKSFLDKCTLVAVKSSLIYQDLSGCFSLLVFLVQASCLMLIKTCHSVEHMIYALEDTSEEAHEITEHRRIIPDNLCDPSKVMEPMIELQINQTSYNGEVFKAH